MKKLFLLATIFLILLPNLANGETLKENVKVAFIRDGFLWTKINGKEAKITTEASKYPFPPPNGHMMETGFCIKLSLKRN